MSRKQRPRQPTGRQAEGMTEILQRKVKGPAPAHKLTFAFIQSLSEAYPADARSRIVKWVKGAGE